MRTLLAFLLALLALLALAPALARAEPLVLVTDRAALADLEANGFDLGSRLGGGPARDNATLARGPFGLVAARIDAELQAAKRADPEAGVGVARFTHRLFDARWLRAPWARFELVGVVDRLDRKPFVGGCGDVRLVYRLAYDKDGGASRLPMTVSVELRAPDDCAEAARRWRPPADLAGANLGAWLRSAGGPLGVTGPIDLVQVNLQSVRWPSAVRPDLGAHAEYLLLSFRPENGALRPAPLENSPDVARLARDPKLRADLVAWLRANLDAVDDGTFLLPERFLTDRSVSVSPRGLARRANRPWLSILKPADLDGLELAGRRTIASPAALVRRLDDATCVGCHQARSVAGFHLLGEDAADSDAANALALPGSPHLFAEVRRRARLVAALADGKPGDFRRPLSDRADDDPGDAGAHCGRGDPGFARWTCAAGLSCDAYDAPKDDDAVGVCLPPKPRLGDACEVGPVVANRDPHRDRVVAPRARPCPDAAVCNQNSVGFPGGMCTAGCDAGDGGTVCGKIAILRGFNDCLARREPFARCLADNATPAALRACDASTPCRDDYLCARAASPGKGACIPPYFLFQMRVDGHP